MHEPYRTLLGHLRHEVGLAIIGIVWSPGSTWLDGTFRQLFGDERQDYAAALHRNYRPGAATRMGTAARQCLRRRSSLGGLGGDLGAYLHMVDVLDTALSFGLDTRQLELEIGPFGRDALFEPDEPGATQFLTFLNGWIELTSVLNEMSRGMGQQDLYPFALPRPAVAKLHFIHLVIANGTGVSLPLA